MIFHSITNSVLAMVTVLVVWQGSSCGSATRVSNNTGNSNVSTLNTNVNSSTDQPQKQRSLPTGLWGGEHVSMEVTEDGAELEFDCAHGTISGRLMVGENGKVSLKGRYAREHGGPIRQGEDQSGQPATYSGSADDKSLTLTITIDENKEEIGTFTLTHGKQGRVRKCL